MSADGQTAFPGRLRADTERDGQDCPSYVPNLSERADVSPPCQSDVTEQCGVIRHLSVHRTRWTDIQRSLSNCRTGPFGPSLLCTTCQSESTWAAGRPRPMPPALDARTSLGDGPMGPSYFAGNTGSNPSTFTRNAHWSAVSSMILAVGFPAPWPARVSMRIRIGLSLA